jgi:hypothetical protein
MPNNIATGASIVPSISHNFHSNIKYPKEDRSRKIPRINIMMIAKGDKCESTFPFFIFPHFADFVQNIKQNPSFAITIYFIPPFW